MPTQLLTASGFAGASAPSALIITNHAWQLTATGAAQVSGSAAVTRRLPDGGLTDFGLWIAGQPDTAMSRDMSRGLGSGSDATTAAGWLTATAPTTYAPGGTPLWNGAAYAGVGIRWSALAAGERHAFDNVQMEVFPSGNRLPWNATSWEGRRCYTAQESSTFSTLQTSADTALSGTRSGKITYTGAPAGTWGYFINPTAPHGMTPCIPAEILSASVGLKMQRAAWWSAGLRFYAADFSEIGTYSSSITQQHLGGGTWDTSYVVSVTAPAGAAWAAVVPYISIDSSPAAGDAIAPAGEIAYCDMHRIWAKPYRVIGTPTAYTAPRKLTIKVLANRVNLINNPGMDTEKWGWGASGYGTAPYPLSWDATMGRTKPGCLKYTLAPDPSTYALATTTGTVLLTAWSSTEIGGFGWQPSTTYTSSFYVKLGPGCPAVTLVPNGYTPTAGVLNTDDAQASHPELVNGDWIRLWATFTTSADDDGLVGLRAMVTSADLPPEGATFWVDDALSESGDQLLPAFDGSSPSADYLWAATAGRSSSHYYRAFRSSAYRLNDIVSAAVPHAVQFTLLYAQPPD